MVFLALYVLFLADEEFDVVVCDQVRGRGAWEGGEGRWSETALELEL
jgi:hypothetical protein